MPLTQADGGPAPRPHHAASEPSEEPRSRRALDVTRMSVSDWDTTCAIDPATREDPAVNRRHRTNSEPVIGRSQRVCRSPTSTSNSDRNPGTKSSSET